MDIIKNKKDLYLIPIEIQNLDCNRDKIMKINLIDGSHPNIKIGWNLFWDSAV